MNRVAIRPLSCTNLYGVRLSTLPRSRLYSTALKVPSLTDDNYNKYLLDSSKPTVLLLYKSNDEISDIAGVKLESWVPKLDWKLNFVKLEYKPEDAEFLQTLARLDGFGKYTEKRDQFPIFYGYHRGSPLHSIRGADTNNSKEIERFLKIIGNYI